MAIPVMVVMVVTAWYRHRSDDHAKHRTYGQSDKRVAMVMVIVSWPGMGNSRGEDNHHASNRSDSSCQQMFHDQSFLFLQNVTKPRLKILDHIEGKYQIA